MQDILEIIDSGDPLSVLFLIIFLFLIGTKMSQTNPLARAWGMRLAAFAWLSYSVYGASVFCPDEADDWISILFRGSLAAGLALGISWICLSVFCFAGHVLGLARGFSLPPVRSRPARSVVCHPAESTLDVCESARRHNEESQRAAERAEAQRRRANARAKVTLGYRRFSVKIRERFTQEMFDEFLAKYMGEDHPPDDVERRGEELLQVLQMHLYEIDPPKQHRTLEEITLWFISERTRIESLPLDDKVKRLHVAALTERYAQLSSELMENLQP